MGYETQFQGEFSVTPPLSEAHREYLLAFAQTRRMKREDEIQTIMGLETPDLPDPIREKVGLPWGPEGSYYVGGWGSNFGQNKDPTIIDFNTPPADQPGLWCQWEPSEGGDAIVPPEDYTKFYDYLEWIEYLIKHFLKPWGYRLDGDVTWQGEETLDHGCINIQNNEVFSGETPHETFCPDCNEPLTPWDYDEGHCWSCDYCQYCGNPKDNREEPCECERENGGEGGD